MSIAVTGGQLEERRFHTTETLAGSTATIARALSLTTPVTAVAGGNYTLADGTEGQQKEIVMSASGSAAISLTGTATGDLVLTLEDDYILTRFTSSKWRLVQSSATTA